MRLKKISEYENSSVFALVEISDSEADDVRDWLEQYCKGHYRMDRFHLVLGHGYDMMFTLKWIR